MKEAVNLAIRLFIITAIATLVLAVLNGLTQPVIAERQAFELAESLGVAYPEGEKFEPLSAEDASQYLEEGSFIKEIYSVNGGEGYVYNVVAKGGYGGDINYIVGIKDSVIQGFSLLSHSETPGFGAAAEEPEFAEGVTGTDASGEIGASKDPADNEIQAISGSTITTTAILNGLNQAAQVQNQLAK